MISIPFKDTRGLLAELTADMTKNS